MKVRLNLTLLAVASATCLAGCVTNDQGQLVIDQDKVHNVIVALNPPPPPPPVEPVVVEEAYEPMPGDVYVANVVDADVVIFHGDTYIWVVGPNGVRHRQFYAHGDHREDVFHRRDDLHRVMVNHGGRLPDHAIAARGPNVAAAGHPGAMPAGHGGPMPVAHAVAAGKPAPAAAKPAQKDAKKTS